jgi:UDP-GlcNAc3NAcA epimerase
MTRSDLAIPPTIQILGPVGFTDMTWLERHAALIVTDSGGVQKEAYFHRTPCVTVRTETEWPETLASGWNRLADPGDSEEIVRIAEASLAKDTVRGEISEYGTGQSAAMLVRLLIAFLAS